MIVRGEYNKDEEKIGAWTWLDLKTGLKIRQICYKDGWKCGKYYDWYENGDLHCDGQYRYNIPVGIWIWYKHGGIETHRGPKRYE